MYKAEQSLNFGKIAEEVVVLEGDVLEGGEYGEGEEPGGGVAGDVVVGEIEDF